jgi:hypothetical protein
VEESYIYQEGNGESKRHKKKPKRQSARISGKQKANRLFE